MEFVRSADYHVYVKSFSDTRELDGNFSFRAEAILRGIGPVLKVVLPVIDQYGDGFPLLSSTAKKASWADSTLEEIGKLAMLRRLAHCERYGLVEAQVYSDSHISIQVIGSDVEVLDRRDWGWLAEQKLEQTKELRSKLSQETKGWARDRIDQYVGVWNEHFIRYESDWELLALYQKHAEASIFGSPEADALPDDAVLGVRSFKEWKQVAIAAIGRAMLHLSFSTRLSFLEEKLDLRNLLTQFVRHEDLKAVWAEQVATENSDDLDDISEIFMLTANHADEYYEKHECPLPYNIRFGKHFALLTQFGYLVNSCAFLVTELKRKYRSDWDRAVNSREQQFQQELYAILNNYQYVRGRENVKVRGASGKIITDIDAVLFDENANYIYLFQLKWFDVVGQNIRERQSKLTNLTKANQWVDQVDKWVSNLTQTELIERLGLRTQISKSQFVQVRLVVLTRNLVNFSGAHTLDRRAAWITWPRLCRILSETPDAKSPLETVWHSTFDNAYTEPASERKTVHYEFAGLQVDVIS